MDRPSFFFSFESALPERAPEARIWRAPEVARRITQKPLEVRVLIVQNDRVPPLID